MNSAKITLFILVFVLIFPIVGVMAKDKAGEGSPPWMEYLNVSNTSKVLVPKGTQTKKIGELTVVESVGEYTARKILEIENKFEAMNKTVGQLIEEIEKLRGNQSVSNLIGPGIERGAR